jgi:glycosyltransferase involved in cell wall biosynthesis
MYILILGNRFPWPLHDGGAIATFQMMKALAFEGHVISYFSYNTKKHFVDEKTLLERFSFCKYYPQELDASVTPLGALKNLFSNRSFHLQRYENEQTNENLAKLLKSESFDIVHIEGLYSAGFLKTVRKCFKGHVSYRSHNIESQIWERLADETSNGVKKFYLKLQSKRLKREEELFWQQVDSIIPIAPDDAKAISLKVNKPMFTYLPGIQIGLIEEVQLQPFQLFHIGSMEWMANIQGVEWFLQKVWPLVKSKVPQIEFHIAGKGLDPLDPRIFQSGVYNHGEVENAKTFMLNHGICVVPVVAGSGIRMKLIEAMSMGIPCVSTKIGVQGIAAENHVHLEIAETAVEMAQAIVNMVEKWKDTVKMGQRAQKLMLQHHNLQKNTQELLAFYANLKTIKN